MNKLPHYLLPWPIDSFIISSFWNNISMQLGQPKLLYTFAKENRVRQSLGTPQVDIKIKIESLNTPLSS